MSTTRVRPNNLKPITDHIQFVEGKRGPAMHYKLGRVIYHNDREDIPKGILNECSGLIDTLRDDYPEGFIMSLPSGDVSIQPQTKGRGLTSSRLVYDDPGFSMLDGDVGKRMTSYYREGVDDEITRIDLDLSNPNDGDIPFGVMYETSDSKKDI